MRVCTFIMKCIPSSDKNESSTSRMLKSHGEKLNQFPIGGEPKEKFHEELEKYRIQIEYMRNKSNELFEKQLIYVSAGTIAGSIFIMDRFLSGIQRGFLFVIISWALLAAGIIVNLLSHFFASNFYNRTIGEITNDRFDNEKADRRARGIHTFNVISLILYFLGLAFFIGYVIEDMQDFNKPHKGNSISEDAWISTYENNKDKEKVKLENMNLKIEGYAKQ